MSEFVNQISHLGFGDLAKRVGGLPSGGEEGHGGLNPLHPSSASCTSPARPLHFDCDDRRPD